MQIPKNKKAKNNKNIEKLSIKRRIVIIKAKIGQTIKTIIITTTIMEKKYK